MSLFDAIKKKAALKTAINQVVVARENEGEKADALFSSAYQGFEFAIHKELMISEALYNWGFALLHQAKTKPAEQATALYQDAVTKFSFCLTIDPDYLGAAIDGGVALMELARLKQVGADDALYVSAKRSFEKANKIQAGSASYNFACVHSLCHDEQACLEALKDAKECGSLPNVDDIMGDPDLINVANKAWFIEFVESLAVIDPQLSLENQTPPSDETAAPDTSDEIPVQDKEPVTPPDNKTEAAGQNNEPLAEEAVVTENLATDAFSSQSFSSKSSASNDNS